MTNVLVNCPDLYTAPPKLAIPGARWDVRKMALTVIQEVTTYIFALGVLPAGHILLDAFLESTDMDNGGTAAALDVGVVNSYYNLARGGHQRHRHRADRSIFYGRHLFRYK